MNKRMSFMFQSGILDCQKQLKGLTGNKRQIRDEMTKLCIKLNGHFMTMDPILDGVAIAYKIGAYSLLRSHLNKGKLIPAIIGRNDQLVASLMTQLKK